MLLTKDSLSTYTPYRFDILPLILIALLLQQRKQLDLYGDKLNYDIIKDVNTRESELDILNSLYGSQNEEDALIYKEYQDYIDNTSNVKEMIASGAPTSQWMGKAIGMFNGNKRLRLAAAGLARKMDVMKDYANNYGTHIYSDNPENISLSTWITGYTPLKFSRKDVYDKAFKRAQGISGGEINNSTETELARILRTVTETGFTNEEYKQKLANGYFKDEIQLLMKTFSYDKINDPVERLKLEEDILLGFASGIKYKMSLSLRNISQPKSSSGSKSKVEKVTPGSVISSITNTETPKKSEPNTTALSLKSYERKSSGSSSSNSGLNTVIFNGKKYIRRGGLLYDGQKPVAKRVNHKWVDINSKAEGGNLFSGEELSKIEDEIPAQNGIRFTWNDIEDLKPENFSWTEGMPRRQREQEIENAYNYYLMSKYLLDPDADSNILDIYNLQKNLALENFKKIYKPSTDKEIEKVDLLYKYFDINQVMNLINSKKGLISKDSEEYNNLINLNGNLLNLINMLDAISKYSDELSRIKRYYGVDPLYSDTWKHIDLPKSLSGYNIYDRWLNNHVFDLDGDGTILYNSPYITSMVKTRNLLNMDPRHASYMLLRSDNPNSYAPLINPDSDALAIILFDLENMPTFLPSSQKNDPHTVIGNIKSAGSGSFFGLRPDDAREEGLISDNVQNRTSDTADATRNIMLSDVFDDNTWTINSALGIKDRDIQLNFKKIFDGTGLQKYLDNMTLPGNRYITTYDVNTGLSTLKHGNIDDIIDSQVNALYRAYNRGGGERVKGFKFNRKEEKKKIKDKLKDYATTEAAEKDIINWLFPQHLLDENEFKSRLHQLFVGEAEKIANNEEMSQANKNREMTLLVAGMAAVDAKYTNLLSNARYSLLDHPNSVFGQDITLDELRTWANKIANADYSDPNAESIRSPEGIDYGIGNIKSKYEMDVTPDNSFFVDGNKGLRPWLDNLSYGILKLIKTDLENGTDNNFIISGFDAGQILNDSGDNLIRNILRNTSKDKVKDFLKDLPTQESNGKNITSYNKNNYSRIFTYAPDYNRIGINISYNGQQGTIYVPIDYLFGKTNEDKRRAKMIDNLAIQIRRLDGRVFDAKDYEKPEDMIVDKTKNKALIFGLLKEIENQIKEGLTQYSKD